MTDVTRPNGDANDKSDESDKSDKNDERKGASTDAGKGSTDIGTGTGTGSGTGTGAGAGRWDPAKAGDRREATTVTPIPRQTDRQADRQTERPADKAAPVHAPEPPPAPVAADKRHGGGADAGNGSLLPHDESDKFSLRLQHAVTGFVDEPRSAVEEAAHVLEEVADRLAQAVTKRRDSLHSSWESKGSDDSDTEQLRLALRDYRELTERLLHI
ncbi:hypothetical protein [Streptomyces sp. MBT53]|uniref:hypothetical protein n=1 Tax=Streptomyces sp. MBT53 TaxID=1488384 RepID=UPI001F32BFFF|nr:hypothetical protein [Streptomyces sp. MBT53]